MDWNDQVILITGGTGSFGKEMIKILLAEYHPGKIIVYSRDELKQHEMRTHGYDHPSLRYFIGDVRDLQRLKRAFNGVDLVVHAAALKQVPACEYNPMEAVKTNILGSQNVVDAALDTGVPRVMALARTRLSTLLTCMEPPSWQPKNYLYRAMLMRLGAKPGSPVFVMAMLSAAGGAWFRFSSASDRQGS